MTARKPAAKKATRAPRRRTPRKPAGPNGEARWQEYLPLAELEPAPTNPKAHDEPLLGESFDRFGFIEPIVLDERTGKIISGHGRRARLLDAQANGAPAPDGVVVDAAGKWQVPVARGWASKDTQHASAAGIALNRIGEGLWNVADLFAELDALRVDDPDGGLAATGFSTKDLDIWRARMEHEAAHDGTAKEDAPEPIRPPKNPKTKPGTVWLLGDHRIICGDCRDLPTVERLVDGRTVNVAFTSPPYAQQRDYDETSGFKPIPETDYVEWFAPVAANVAHVLADDGSWFVNIKPSAADLDTSLYVFDLVCAHARDWGWHFVTELCWERLGVPKRVSRRFKNQFEPIYHFARNEFKMRPDEVRHYSRASITPLGPGADTGWKDKQGDRGVIPQHDSDRMRRKYGTTSQGGAPVGNSVAEVQRRNQLGSLKAIAEGAKREPSTRATASGSFTRHQGSTGEFFHGDIGEGLAYPGNRLPTFAGSHETTGHAAAFPVGLPAFFARAYADEGDVIYDPFMGSGSTLLAAHNAGRVGLGVEISPAYCDVVVERWERHTGLTARRQRGT